MQKIMKKIKHYISERSSSTKLKEKRLVEFAGYITLAGNQQWVCDIVWRIRYFCFLARRSSYHLEPWCTMIVQGDTTRPAVDSSELSEAVKE